MTNVDEVVKNFLEHYGVKGMRWGIRKDTSGSSSAAARKAARRAPQPVVVTTTKRGRIKTTGGARQPATDEAKRTAATRQKANMSGTKALTNAELQQAVNRMNLEQQFKRLESGTGVQKFINDFLKNQGKQQANKVGNDLVAEALKKKSNG